MAARKFNTTNWSLLHRIRSEDSAEMVDAMDTLCRDYWSPLYAWLRGSGHDPTEAEDLTQGFFARVISKNLFEKADPEKGRLRSFLLTSLRNYVYDEKVKERTEKRGGGVSPVSLDHIESRAFDLTRSAAPGETNPENLFDYRWARMVMQHALARLRQEHEASGKTEWYCHFAPLLVSGESDSPARTKAEIGRKLELSDGATRVAFHRFKKRFREIVREEVARTISSEEDVEEELRYLVQVLTRS